MGFSAVKHNRPEVDFESLKVRVDRVHVDGLERTKDDFITDTFKDVFRVHNFQELLERTIETRLKLERLGCFKTISIVIDTSKGPKATPDHGYDVTFKVTELNRVTGRINTAIENNQGSIGFVLQTPNLMGRGESLKSEIKYTPRQMQIFNTSFTKPLLFNEGSLSSSIFKQCTENAASGYKLSEYGMQLGLSFLYGGILNHDMTYEGIIRKAGVLNKNVAFPIRETSGYSLKSSVKNSFVVDSRDSTIFPTSGGLFHLKTEFAGLGGDIGYFKNELFSQLNVPLFADISLQGSFGAGIITETTKDKYYSTVDRFFLGGPLTLRGFPINTVGPKVDGYALGGSLYWISAFHLYTPLPHRPKKGTFGDSFRTHFFVNAGNLLNPSDNLNECVQSLGKNLRLTYGIGLVYRLGQVARIELNYCIPVYYQADDKLIDGVQFGLGVQFV